MKVIYLSMCSGSRTKAERQSDTVEPTRAKARGSVVSSVCIYAGTTRDPHETAADEHRKRSSILCVVRSGCLQDPINEPESTCDLV